MGTLLKTLQLLLPSMSRNKRGNRLFQLRMVLKLRAYLKDSEIFTALISPQSTFEVGNKNCANEKQQCLVVFTFQFGSMKITGEVNKFAGTKDMRKLLPWEKSSELSEKKMWLKTHKSYKQLFDLFFFFFPIFQLLLSIYLSM